MLASSGKKAERNANMNTNGEYDWIMGEQKGWLTPQMTSFGGRCHDEQGGAGVESPAALSPPSTGLPRSVDSPRSGNIINRPTEGRP